MKKINTFLVGMFLTSSISFVYATEKNNQDFIEKPISTISHYITNVEQYGHSDGYTTTQKNGIEEKLLVGTNHYKAQMQVTYNHQKVNINIMYSIRDIKVTSNEETKNTPSNITIGQETFNEDSISKNKNFNTHANKEIEKLQSIGLSKREFDNYMHRHFKSIYYL